MLYRFSVLLILAGGLLAACGGETVLPTPTLDIAPSATSRPATPAPPTLPPTAVPPPATIEAKPQLSDTPQSPTPTAIPPSPVPVTPTAVPTWAACSLGTGLRKETAEILVAYKDHPGLVMCATAELAGTYFPQLEGWTRVLGAPSLATLQQKAERAAQTGVPYEALGYGLETSRTTPDEEWGDLVGSTQAAQALSDQHNKLLVMGPGFRLMSQNQEKYDEMAFLTDIWIFQTQDLQRNPPGPEYRKAVEEVVKQIRAGNPNIVIWAQITLPPDREPDAEEWLAYRQSIADLVDGTYIGVYTWQMADTGQLVATIEAIFAACGGEP